MTAVAQGVRELSQRPGVYIYRNQQRQILYIGKAANLKKRVTQYFAGDDAVGAKTERLVSQIADIETIPTASEFDALLLEAKLIHEHQPKYNIIAKDDKSPLYVRFTFSQSLPRVELVRKRALMAQKTNPKDTYFGPFGSARILRSLLGQLRSSIPYCTQKVRSGRPCFYTHLGLCGPCPSVIAALPAGKERQRLTVQYRRQLFGLRDIFRGRATAVLVQLEKAMRRFARTNDFERAAIARNQWENLYRILEKKIDPSVYIETEATIDVYQQERTELAAALCKLYPQLGNLSRIECVDISNVSGTNATGSLVVAVDGHMEPSLYRRFRIRSGTTPNDVAMQYEVISRRLHHSEWPFPDLLLVDGGKGQVRAALGAMQESQVSIPVAGIAKRYEELIVPQADSFVVLRLPYTSGALHLVQRIRDESHRFAKSYHVTLRRKSFDKTSGV